jgi:endonuclease-3 related protein
MINERLMEIHRLLRERFGELGWWPAQSGFEVAVGAILTQNTAWANVEKAIANLKRAGILSAPAINACPDEQLAEFIRPSGYFNIKTKRLKAFTRWLMNETGGEIELLKDRSLFSLREDLLAVKGIGRETADSIILYALDKPTFVVDSYTARIFIRHQLLDEYADYEQIKEFFEGALPQDTGFFNEFHALIVELGKNYCKKSRPKCTGCPLEHLPHRLDDDY